MMQSLTDSSLPKSPVSQLLSPIRRFLNIQASSGIILLACAVIALVIANSPWASSFAHFWETRIEVSLGGYTLAGTLGHLLINDGLMTIFFFVVGLEIKRELLFGELADWRKALLPILGAIGGIVAPALVYLSLQFRGEGQGGWAIPMATDIAFVVGLLAMFGDRVPLGLKVFLLSLAIVDDLAAILIIAFVFSESVSIAWLAIAAGGLFTTLVLRWIGVRLVAVYVLVGIVIWLACYKSGIHPTVAGVVLGLMTPTTAWIPRNVFSRMVEEVWQGIDSDDDTLTQDSEQLKELRVALRETVPPLHRLEHTLHPWVAFFIMPLFALANTGVAFEVSALGHPVSLAVTAGLLIGKPLGIVLISAAAVGLGLCSLPRGVNWLMFVGGACLGGIGFTMALFLNSLSFPVNEVPDLESAGKIGTLLGSVLSAVLGIVLLLFSIRGSDLATHGADS